MKIDQILKVGEAAPDFDLAASNNDKLSLEDLKGKFAVIVFYPKNNTPG